MKGSQKGETEELAGNEDLNGRIFDNLTLSAEHFVKRGHDRIAAYVELGRCKAQHYAQKYDIVMEYGPPQVSLI